jgi:flavin-dependent dehydrogenase
LIDLAIIGGGPAGTAAAIEARRRGLSTAVFERERFPRHKVCGEFISAESLPFLKAEIPHVLAAAASITRVEFVSARGKSRAFDLPAPARGLSRLLLDEALWEAAARAGADTNEGEKIRRVRRFSQGRETGWEIESEGGAVQRARALIVACGRWWKIEGLESPTAKARRGSRGVWIGAKAHFTGVEPKKAVEMFHFPGGYCGLAPVEGGIYNACCLVHRDLVRRVTGNAKDFASWISAIARHPALNARLRPTIQTCETMATAPVRTERKLSAFDGALFAGDSKSFIDPFTGDGISMALQSGRMAAEELAKALTLGFSGLGFVARSYERRLSESVRRSFAVARLLGTLVQAPSPLQHLAAGAIARLGPRLVEGTRWQKVPPPCCIQFPTVKQIEHAEENQ